MQNNPSPIARHFFEHPSFTGDDIGMRNGAEEATPKQGRHHITSAHVMFTKAALTEHVSAKAREDGGGTQEAAT